MTYPEIAFCTVSGYQLCVCSRFTRESTTEYIVMWSSYETTAGACIRLYIYSIPTAQHSMY